MIGHNVISLFHITVSVTEIPQVWETCEYDQMELQRKHTEYMMTLPNGKVSVLLALCEGIHRPPMDSPHKGPVTRALMFYLMLV